MAAEKVNIDSIVDTQSFGKDNYARRVLKKTADVVDSNADKLDALEAKVNPTIAETNLWAVCNWVNTNDLNGDKVKITQAGVDGSEDATFTIVNTAHQTFAHAKAIAFVVKYVDADDEPRTAEAIKIFHIYGADTSDNLQYLTTENNKLCSEIVLNMSKNTDGILQTTFIQKTGGISAARGLNISLNNYDSNGEDYRLYFGTANARQDVTEDPDINAFSIESENTNIRGKINVYIYAVFGE